MDEKSDDETSKKACGIEVKIETKNEVAKNIHHTARFGVSQSHNPYFIAPLCKQHHDIAHVMDERMIEMKMGK